MQSISASLWQSLDQEIEKDQQIVSHRDWQVSDTRMQSLRVNTFSLNYPYSKLTGIRASTFQTSTELEHP